MRWVIVRGVVGAVLITIGGFCYAHLSHPSWVDSSPLAELRESTLRVDLGLALGAAGLLLLTWAWWGLRAFAHDDATGVTSVRIALGCWSVPLLIAPPLFSGDGWSYVATGYLTGHGFSPYVWTPDSLPVALRSGVNGRWLHTVSPYGPLAQGWGGLAAQVTSNPWALLVAYRVFALVGIALLAWATPRLAVRAGLHPGDASWLVLASPFVIAHGIGGLHNDIVVAGLGLAALAATTRDRWVWGAVLAGAAAAVKVPGGMIAIGVVLLSLQVDAKRTARLGRAVGVAAVAAATVLGLGVVTGVGSGWISALSVPTSVPSQLSLTYNVGTELRKLVAVLHLSLVVPDGMTIVSLVQAAGVILLAAGALWLVLYGRNHDDGVSLAAVAALMFAATMLSPVTHYWYFLWCLPLVACARVSVAVRRTLIAGVAVLGLTALADPSLHVAWLSTTSGIAVVCVPVLVFFGSRGWKAQEALEPASR
ncbi:MAG: hypothetical protein JWP74_3647 [Marmoricola sp.]|nr:hypothetical protein [Marmoricola sp.]